jgi:hypothetical protein
MMDAPISDLHAPSTPHACLWSLAGERVARAISDRERTFSSLPFISPIPYSLIFHDYY